jgi:hypothetical protein
MSVSVGGVNFEDNPGVYIDNHIAAAKTIKAKLLEKATLEQKDLLTRLKSFKGDKTRVLAAYVLLTMHVDEAAMPSLDRECLIALAQRTEEPDDTLRVANPSMFRRSREKIKLPHILAVAAVLLLAILVNWLL